MREMSTQTDIEVKKEYEAHWLEDIIKKVVQRNPKKVVLSTGKTPSGHVHLGILRELLICDGIRRILTKRQVEVEYRLFFDSLDAAKRFPGYIPKDFSKKYLGQPFAYIPNPFDAENTDSNYAKYFGEELMETFPQLGIKVEAVWTNELYKTKEMKEMIRIGLRKNEEVKQIVAKYLTASMPDDKKQDYLEQQKDWMGAMVICEKCQRTQMKLKDGKIKPNRVMKYDPENDEVDYECPACGYQGTVKVSSGLLKLNWRLDWPAKWTMFNTTCEPAGKDHCTPGGSYDTGLDLCQNIYGYEGPVKVAYEWLRLGDNDMKTSKGIVFTPQKFLSLADPRIIRMIIYQTNPNKHISFRVEEMEQYYNEYERMERIFFGKEEANSKSEKREIDYIYPLIQINEIPKVCPENLPYKLITILAQLLPILGEDGAYTKAVEHMEDNNFTTILPKESLLEKLNLANNWVEEIKIVIKEEKNPKKIKELNNKIVIFSFIKDIDDSITSQLEQDQKDALKAFNEGLGKIEKLSDENIKGLMMEIQKTNQIKAKKLFQAIYLLFFGQKKGPRLGPLMVMLGKEWIITRLDLGN